jgi:hypothetical protein
MGTAIALCLAAGGAQVAISARSVGVGVVNCVGANGDTALCVPAQLRDQLVDPPPATWMGMWPSRKVQLLSI